jgi:hypothetical protein
MDVVGKVYYVCVKQGHCIGDLPIEVGLRVATLAKAVENMDIAAQTAGATVQTCSLVTGGKTYRSYRTGEVWSIEVVRAPT